MRRLIITAVCLSLVAPALATVTVTARHIGLPVKAGIDCATCEVNYVCSAGESIRAFALDIAVDNGFTIDTISDFNVGESNKVGGGIVTARRGYGIFPGKFRDTINPADPCWIDPNYNPIAPTGDPNAGTGLGTNRITVEMGSLYLGDNNAPPSSGTLFRFKVNTGDRTGIDCNLTITANNTRGGVVDSNGNQITPVLVGGKISFTDSFPCWGCYAPQYAEWLTVWKPRCWSGKYLYPPDANWRSQCWGDADGKYEGPISRYRVYQSDYTKLTQAWGKKATALRSSMGPDGGLLCADFDHKYEGPVNKYRVYSSDYVRLLAGWRKKDTTIRSTLGWCPNCN